MSTLAPIVVTASELGDYEWCPEYHGYRWKERRRPITLEPEWALLGTWTHLQLERMMQGHPPSRDLQPPIPNAKGRALLSAVHAWWERYGLAHPWDQVLHAETAQMVDIGALKSGRRVLLKGIPDAWVMWNNMLWHCSHKTLDERRPVASFTAGLACELHEGLYPLLGREAWPGLTYGGTMANIIRKMAEKRKDGTPVDPFEALHIEFIPISEERIASAVRDTLAICEDIESGRIRRRRRSCTGVYGNSLCAYYEICWRGARLDSPLFETFNPLERYEGEA